MGSETAHSASQPDAGGDSTPPRLVLFVCTGNTCRSPMAETIARALLAAGEPDDRPVPQIASAGVAAGDGLPASSGAIEAMRRRGLDLGGHRSAHLTPEMLEAAAIIYTMTPTHALAAKHLAPDAAHKIEMLDPTGAIGDPIGGAVELYERTADRIEQLITQRLAEIHP